MKRVSIITLLSCLLLISCSSEPSLQKYFVENSENSNFIALDISPTILNLNKAKLTAEQSEALSTFDKMNVLAFKLDSTNTAELEVEKTEVLKILKDQKYQELIKVGNRKNGASISFVGDEKNIDEFVVYATQDETGFAVIRILGDDMNPTGIMTMLSMLKDANVDMEQLAPLQQFIKK